MTALLALRIAAAAVVASVLLVGLIKGLGDVGASGGAFEGVDGTTSETTAVVLRVIDGDTFTTRHDDGAVHRVRLLGIDTPEMPGDCYATQAASALAALLPPGARVTLVDDPTQDHKDDYGRLLRYARTSAGDIGLRQLETGAADVLPSRTPVQRHATYRSAQEAATAHNEGKWGRC